MVDFSEFFSDDVKKKFAETNIKIGSIIKSFVKNTYPPKEKYFVILGILDDKTLLGVIFINTNINFNILNTVELKLLQYPVNEKQYDFLAHNSFIDCSQIYEQSYTEIIEKLIEKPQNIVGELNDEDLERVIELVKSSPKIAPKMLKKYGLI